jgi:glutathione-regulated potassium-efflux system ancillary protein KefG
MLRILVLFAHPRLEKSRANRALLKHFPKHKNITLHDLYEAYPDFNIDVRREQALLEEHDVVVLHHPFYWYSVPPLLKQYIDLVYSFGWAYGPGGTALKDKLCFHVLTSGGNEQAYSEEGFHGNTLHEFLLPLKRTATLCGMRWLPPFAVQGTNRLDDAALEQAATQLSALLQGLADGHMDPASLTTLDRLNKAVSTVR